MIEDQNNLHQNSQNEQDNYDEKFSYEKLSKRDMRSVMFHLLYALESNDYNVSIESIIDDLNRGFDLDIPVNSEPVLVVQNIANIRSKLDVIIQRFLVNWRLERLGVSTRLVLYLGIWEMLNTDTPPTIVINEAVELAKCFSELDAYKFINAVLDEVSKKIEELKLEVNIKN